MKKLDLLPRLTILSLVIAFLVAFTPPLTASSEAGPGITFSPASINLLACGEEIQFAVRVEDVADLYAYSLQLSFPPGSLEILEVSNGGFLSEGFYEPSNGFDNAAGTLSFGMSQVNPTPSKSGSGELILIRARAGTLGGSAPLAINAETSALVNGMTFLPISYSAENGVMITPYCISLPLIIHSTTTKTNFLRGSDENK
jgi:hypothetical protein